MAGTGAHGRRGSRNRGRGPYPDRPADAGITKEQLTTIRTEVTPGTSALLLVTEEGDLDRVGERFRGMHNKLIATNLTEGERQILLETFDGRCAPPRPPQTTRTGDYRGMSVER